MTTSEKVAYLKGLFEGLGVDKDSNEGRLFTAVIDALQDIAFDVEDLAHSTEDLAESVDLLSDDLAELEDVVYSGGENGEDDEDEDEDPIFYEVTCPSCGETITIDEDVLGLGNIECPNCGEPLEFDLSEEDEDGEPTP